MFFNKAFVNMNSQSLSIVYLADLLCMSSRQTSTKHCEILSETAKDKKKTENKLHKLNAVASCNIVLM